MKIDLDRPLCINISQINEADEKLQAAVLLACWGEGFGAIAAQHALSDAGLEPKRNYFIVLDELWRVLRAGKGLVDRVDALTRLNRQAGVGMALVTHTLADLEALPEAADQLKAMGFAERAGYIVCGGLPAKEIPKLSKVVHFSKREEELITDWASPPSWDPESEQGGPAAGPGEVPREGGGASRYPVGIGHDHGRARLARHEQALGPKMNGPRRALPTARTPTPSSAPARSYVPALVVGAAWLAARVAASVDHTAKPPGDPFEVRH